MNNAVCKSCKREVMTLVTLTECHDCAEKARSDWQERMSIRQDPAQFDTRKLVNILLTQHWMHECEISYEGASIARKCVVRYTYKDGSSSYLRYSLGPLQGYSWDVYGDDMHYPELALVAISQAPAPPRVDCVISTHGT